MDTAVEKLEETCKTAKTMICYEARLKSFRKWPMKQPTPAKLAAAGFYYTGVDDEVMSPFMMKQIGGWEEDDEPMKEALKRKSENAYLSRRWSPKDCLEKKEDDMTLNEWYRMNSLFRETELAYQIEAMSEALELDIAKKNEQIDGDCTVGDLEVRMKSYEKRCLAIIASLKKRLVDQKAANGRRFKSQEPKTGENDAWMAGRWNMKMSEVKSANKLPVPSVKQSRQSLMISSGAMSSGPPSAQKPAQRLDYGNKMSMASIAE